MAGLETQAQVNTWQLTSVNVDRQCSSDISVITEKLLKSVRMHSRVPVIFSIPETRSWDAANLELSGYLCYGIVGFGSVLQNEEIVEVRSTAVLFGTTLVMAVYAPAGKTEMYEAFISSVTKVLQAGRRGGAREF